MRNNRGILILVGLFAVLIVPAPAGPSQSLDENSSSEYVRVTAVGPEGGRSGSGAGDALAALAVGALRARGVRARAEPPPLACAPPSPADGRACRGALLAALAGGELHAALVPAPAADAADAFALRDLGIEDVGDAAPLSRRGCFATRPPRATAPAPPAPARSLLDLADASLAARYRLADRDIVAAVRRFSLTNNETCTNCTFVNVAPFPEWCSGETCATLLTSDEAEATVLEAVISEHRLLARVACLGAGLAGAAAVLATPAILCERAPMLTLPDRLRVAPLGPPFCTDVSGPCPFEPRRLVKLVNAPALAPLSPRALHVLARFTLSAQRLRELIHEARKVGADVAAQRFLAAHPGWPGGPAGEVRAGVLLPLSGTREAYDALSLAAAAELAEEDEATAAGGAGAGAGDVTFKVELFDDGCAATNAFKYLTDSLGTEYHALSGVAGPACGTAFADVARQSPTHRLPVLAYTWQAAPATGRYAVLGAGEARRGVEAAAALVAALGWRRMAVLSELATRATLDVAQLRADVVVHVELPDDTRQPLYELVTRWAERVSKVNGRVLYVCVEDALVVRTALCAGRRAGLVPAAGAVWLLPAALPPRWLEPRARDTHPCTADQLAEVAAGHLSVAPEWLAAWDDATATATAGAERTAWEARWRARCLRAADATQAEGACSRPGPHAALLYDTLRLWAAALARMLAAHPAALDDLHDELFVRALIENATTVPYTGLTGPFTWSSEGSNGGRARSAPLMVRQWQGVGGEARCVARWTRAGGLQLDSTLLRWQTADGAAPDDGGERCGLQPLADLLRTDCRTAFVALAAVVLALLVAALAAAALHCKRRAEREYRARLAALGLRTLSPKPGGLDKWEVPRERVVINRKLGTGAFGTVYGGHALLAEDRGWSAVAVKTLKPGASTEEKLDFLSEAEAMKRFDHKNVVRLLGVVTKTEPVCTVMEFMLYGDLKNYLLARRHLAAGVGRGEGDADEVSAARLTSMALDAARALSYLAQLRYVHRDVAARNCLVSAHRIVKLADFGMTRLVFENDYYRFSRKGMLPVRWMAPESLALGVFSPASDVWSFGVLLYEIVTFGSLPFQGLSNAEVLARVKAGHTLDLPHGLKPQLEGLIKSCWRQEHKARPGAAEVAAFLADSARLLTPCLDVPLDALPLDADADADADPDAPWRLPRDRAEARWVSWAAPASATTDTTYLSADPPPQDTDAFLP